MSSKELRLVIQLAVQGLLTNKGRTMLTTLGIVIGIATIVMVLSAGRGLEGYINGQMETFGADTIQVEVKIPSVSEVEMASAFVAGAEITTLKVADFEALKTLPNVDQYYAGTFGQYMSVYKNRTSRSMIYAVTAGLADVDMELKLAEGRFYTEREERSQARVVVLGPEVKSTLFGDEDALGKNIRVNQINFRVIGVTEPRGSMMYFNFDKMIYMPLLTAQKQLLGIDHVMYGFMSVHDTTLIEQTVDEITSMMRRRHGIPPGSPDKDDFRVMSMREAMEMVGTVTFGMTLLVMLIAGISLVVGGVGIMNIMYLSVVERTREIGLRKAVGASNGIVRLQFLVEAVLITVVGGVMGVLVGSIMVMIMGVVVVWQGFDFNMAVSLDSVVVGLLSAMVFGLLFGLYPARKASALSPVDALRYE